MRAPFQVLVIPFRRRGADLEFAVLKRRDAQCWQFVAGGGESGETPLQAAARETEEEIGIGGGLMRLDSLSTVPKDQFAAADKWADTLYVIPEFCFAVDVGSRNLCLSQEHSELRWLPYEQAYRLVEWDSNRNALWELNERLKRMR
jgi:dATP pyrophosphohydrolase